VPGAVKTPCIVGEMLYPRHAAGAIDKIAKPPPGRSPSPTCYRPGRSGRAVSRGPWVLAQAFVCPHRMRADREAPGANTPGGRGLAGCREGRLMVTRADRPRRKLRGGSIDIEWEEKTRRKIQTSMITNRLIDYVNGKIKLEPAQVTAALGLMRKGFA
jgi:hypothetical protein